MTAVAKEKLEGGGDNPVVRTKRAVVTDTTVVRRCDIRPTIRF